MAVNDKTESLDDLKNDRDFWRTISILFIIGFMVVLLLDFFGSSFNFSIGSLSGGSSPIISSGGSVTTISSS